MTGGQMAPNLEGWKTETSPYESGCSQRRVSNPYLEMLSQLNGPALSHVQVFTILPILLRRKSYSRTKHN